MKQTFIYFYSIFEYTLSSVSCVHSEISSILLTMYVVFCFGYLIYKYMPLLYCYRKATFSYYFCQNIHEVALVLEIHNFSKSPITKLLFQHFFHIHSCISSRAYDFPEMQEHLGSIKYRAHVYFA